MVLASIGVCAVAAHETASSNKATPRMRTSVLVANRIAKIVSTHAGTAEKLVILDGIDLEINAGESVAVVGASGSGKTTLLGILAGLDTPTSGTVALDGHELTQLSEEERARLRGELVGFVFQSFQLLGQLDRARERDAAGRTEGRCGSRRRRARIVASCRVGRADEPLSAPALGRRTATCSDRARVCVAIRRSCSPTSRPATSTL